MNTRAARARLAARLRYVRFSRFRRRLVLGAGLLVGLGAVWIAVTGYLARQEAAAVGDRIAQAKLLVAQGRIADARTVARDIPALAARARRLTTGPAWWIGAHVPYVGEPLDVTRQLTAALDDVGSDALPKLIDAAESLDPGKLRTTGSTIRLAPLVAARPDVEAAATTLDGIERRLARLPGGGWLPAVDSARDRVRGQLDSVRGYVDAAARATRLLPAMLGDTGTKRYFVGLQNEAELRGTGGLPGAFTIVEARHGTVRFTRFESDRVLLPAKTRALIPTGLDFGKDYDAAYAASAPTSSYPDSNVSPHFPYAARIWAAMWQKVSGQRVDGVLAVDPTALQYFLDAVGPAKLAGGRTLTGRNVVTLTERDQYSIFTDNAARKRFVVAVLEASARKLTSGSGSASGILRAASRASSEHRLLVWSTDPAQQRLIEQSDYAGAIPQSSQPFGALVVNNAAAGKLDYYLTRSVTYRRTGCGSKRDTLVTITLGNNAPAAGLPAYVTNRLDSAAGTAKPGDNRALVDYYATKRALLRSVTLNGKSSTAAVLTGRGHPIFRIDLELPRGSTQTMVLHLVEPGGSDAPQIWRQPGVTSTKVQVFDQSCG